MPTINFSGPPLPIVDEELYLNDKAAWLKKYRDSKADDVVKNYRELCLEECKKNNVFPLLNIGQVLDRYNLEGEGDIHWWVKYHGFPSPFVFPGKLEMWSLREIELWDAKVCMNGSYFENKIWDQLDAGYRK